MRTNLEQHQYLQNTQSTHGAAAEASAARLILLLKKDFQVAQEEISGTNSALIEQIKNEEKYLAAYITHVMRHNSLPTEGSLARPESIHHIQGILDFVDYILLTDSLPHVTIEQKKAVGDELIRLIGLGTDHWTKNRIFLDGTVREVDASLRETLNLVCKGLMWNQEGYSALEAPQTSLEESAASSSLEASRKERVRALFSCLYGLSQTTLCTAGRQHELLFLLNDVYPARQADGSYQRIKLIEDTSGFLVERLYSFLAEQFVQTTALQDKDRLAIYWVMNQCSVVGKNSSLSSWMGAQVGGLRTYLKEQAVQYGLNPESEPLARTIELYCDTELWNAPSEINPLMPLLVALFSSKKDEQNTPRNNALKRLQHEVAHADSFEAIKEAVSVFMHVERAHQELENIGALALFIGEEEGALQEAIDSLSHEIQRFFSSESSPQELPQSFNNAHEVFRREQRTFKAHINTEFISNFFAILGEGTSSVLDQLQRLQIEHRKQSLLLTDSVIGSWMPREGNELQLSPYQINRVLIHVILMVLEPQATERSVDFMGLLSLCVRWLQEHPENEPGLDAQFKASYSPRVLSILYTIALCVHLPFFREFIKNNLGSSDFYSSDLLSTLISIDSLDAQQRNEIWNAVRENLGTLIQEGGQLVSLLELSPECLTEGQRTEIWNAVSGNLGTLIKEGGQLVSLLNLSQVQLTEGQRNDIWDAVSGKLGTLIKEGGQLISLLKLSFEDQRNEIWGAVRGKLETLIQGGGQLVSLLELSPERLTEGQRNDIWAAVRGKLETLIESNFELIRLLKLSPEYLRNEIWGAVRGKLETLIQGGGQLVSLLELSPERLTEGQRNEIWGAVRGKLGTLLDLQLIDLLCLSPERLGEKERSEIWDVVRRRLGHSTSPDDLQAGHSDQDKLNVLLDYLQAGHSDPERLKNVLIELFFQKDIREKKKLCHSTFGLFNNTPPGSPKTGSAVGKEDEEEEKSEEEEEKSEEEEETSEEEEDSGPNSAASSCRRPT